MMMRYLLFALLLVLSACANKAGSDLPMVNAGDPVWALQPDQLAGGMLPR